MTDETREKIASLQRQADRLEDSVKRGQADAEESTPSYFAGVAFLWGTPLGVIIAIGVYCNCIKSYRANDALGISIFSAILVIACAVLISVYFGAQTQKDNLNLARQLRQQHDQLLDEIESLQNPNHRKRHCPAPQTLKDRFAKNELVHSFINLAVQNFCDQIRAADRSSNKQNTSCTLSIIVRPASLSTGPSTQEISFDKARLYNLDTYEERRALAEVIAEGIKEHTSATFPIVNTDDISCIDIRYQNAWIDPNSDDLEVYAHITYSCRNGNYRERTDW